MNKFLRISYIIGFLYTLLLISAESMTGIAFPIWCFVALYVGILLFMLPVIISKLQPMILPLRIGGIVIALLGSLFLTNRPIGYLIINLLLAAIGFTLSVVFKYDTIHRDFEAKFKFSVVVLALIFAASTMLSGGGFTSIFDIESVRSAMVNAIPCLVITLAMGILLLRGLRASIGVVDTKEFNKRQLKDTLIFFTLCIVLWATDILSLIKTAFEFIINHTLVPFIKWIVGLLGQFTELLVNQNPPQSGSGTATPSLPPHTDITPLPESTPQLTTPPSQMESSNALQYVLYIITAIFVIVIFWVIFAKLLKRGYRGKSLGYPNETRESIDLVPDDHKEKPLSRLNRNPRMRIRYIYFEFLKHMRVKGVNIGKSDTSKEIETTAKTVIFRKRNEIADLSDVYRKARYKMTSEPTADDAKLAKKLYDSIKNGD